MNIGDQTNQANGIYYSTEYECEYIVENGVITEVTPCSPPLELEMEVIRTQRLIEQND